MLNEILVSISVDAEDASTPHQPLALRVEIDSDAKTLAEAIPQALAHAAVIAAERLNQPKWEAGRWDEPNDSPSPESVGATGEAA